MFGWLKRIFSRSTKTEPPNLQDTQNAWIEAKCKEWQMLWHDYFDSDQDIVAAGDLERPAEIPKYFDDDLRLFFGLSHATLATRKKCFALFPNGEEMNQRFEEHLTSSPVAISEPQARSRLARVISMIEEIGPNAETDFSSIEIVDLGSEEGREKINQTDSIRSMFERSWPVLDQDDELERCAADLFLSEPLYVSAGNYYELGNWVTAVLQGGREDALQTELYRLWDAGWTVRLGRKGVVLAHRKV